MERVQFDGRRMAEDLAAVGWNASDLATKARVAKSTVTRFLSGEHQTPRMAKRLAKALGYATPRRYVVSQDRSLAGA